MDGHQECPSPSLTSMLQMVATDKLNMSLILRTGIGGPNARYCVTNLAHLMDREPTPHCIYIRSDRNSNL
jgi:hypothetical protein